MKQKKFHFFRMVYMNFGWLFSLQNFKWFKSNKRKFEIFPKTLQEVAYQCYQGSTWLYKFTIFEIRVLKQEISKKL